MTGQRFYYAALPGPWLATGHPPESLTTMLTWRALLTSGAKEDNAPAHRP